MFCVLGRKYEMKLKRFSLIFLFQKSTGKQDYPYTVDFSSSAQTRSLLKTPLTSHSLSFSLACPPRRPESQRRSQRPPVVRKVPKTE